MCYLMARCAEGDKILGNVIAQSASRLNVMDLKALHSTTPLATPAVSLQDLAAELAISFKVKLQARSSCTDPSQSITRIFSRSWDFCCIGRLSAKRVNEVRRASVLPVSKLTPARKSAQIISRQ